MPLKYADIKHGYFVICKQVMRRGVPHSVRVCQKSTLKAAENEIARIAERSWPDRNAVEQGRYTIDGPCYMGAKRIREQAARKTAPSARASRIAGTDAYLVQCLNEDMEMLRSGEWVASDEGIDAHKEIIAELAKRLKERAAK